MADQILQDSEERVFFPGAEGTDAFRYHVLCAPQQSHYQVEIACQFEGFSALSAETQRRVAFQWEGADPDFHSEDSDSDPDDPGSM